MAAGILLAAGSAGAKPTTKAQLPVQARAAFVKLMRGTDVIPSKGWVSFTSLGQVGNSKAMKFAFSSGNKSGVGYALRYKQQWVFTTQPVTSKDLSRVTRAMVGYLKENFFPDQDVTPGQIAKYCKAVRPQRTIWQGETSDPQGLVSSFPMVFCLSNPTGTDHGFFVGYDPASHATQAYDFN
jgi:hypothetical protein